MIIDNYADGETEDLDAVNNPEDASAGSRTVPFSREIYIERDDFMEEPPKKFFRLAPGREVRLRYAYFITCCDVVKDGAGEVTALHCTYDPETRGGNAPDGRKVKGTLHWVSAAHALGAEARLYDPLFAEAIPGAGGEMLDDLDPQSMTVLEECRVEPALASLSLGETVQFERLGYFCLDAESRPGSPVFNRTVSLRDTWARMQAKSK